MRGSEDNLAVRCLLVGGPHDGAHFVVEGDLPEYWWIRPAHGSGGRFDLLARPNAERGGERYILSAFEGGSEAFYQHETVKTDIGTRAVETFA